MADNRSCAKPDFDWSSYEKRPRRLTDRMEDALFTGHLRPILEMVLSDPELRFDIRDGKTNLYFKGGNLLRLRGTRRGIVGEWDSNYLALYREQRSRESLREIPLNTSRDVDQCVAQMRADRKAMTEWWQHHLRTERTYEQWIASANECWPGTSSDYLVIDIEYQIARRRFDLVALGREPGTSGLAGFARPRLVLCELKCKGQALNGDSGLACHGVDFISFVAADGQPLERSREELGNLVKQKVKLGLLPQGLRLDAFDSQQPEFLVMFADYDVARAELTRPLEKLQEAFLEKPELTDCLRFMDFPSAAPDDPDSSPDPESLRMLQTSAKDYGEFAAYRKAL